VSIIALSALEYMYAISKYITDIISLIGLCTAAAIVQISLDIPSVYRQVRLY
jgi:hypothetical protein